MGYVPEATTSSSSNAADRLIQVALVKALAANPSNTVIGVARDKKATEDRLAADGVTNVHILSADINDEAKLKHVAEEASRILGSQGLDVLIHNAAYLSYWSGLKSLKDL